MKNDLIAAAWDSYLKQLMHPSAGEVQIRETRKAFYAGATALFFMLIELFADDKEPTEADLTLMSDVERELNEFAKEQLKK
jgi:hypothetical protein